MRWVFHIFYKEYEWSVSFHFFSVWFSTWPWGDLQERVARASMCGVVSYTLLYYLSHDVYIAYHFCGGDLVYTMFYLNMMHKSLWWDAVRFTWWNKFYFWSCVQSLFFRWPVDDWSILFVCWSCLNCYRHAYVRPVRVDSNM